MRKLSVVLGILFMLPAAFQAGAEAVASETWVVPEEGAVEMFRQGDRAFTVGSDAGGAGAVVDVTAELKPAPGGCTPISSSKCSQNVETCSGSCTAYLNYYCKTCDCGSFNFCG